MTFTSDFVSMKSGDMYPIIEKRGDCVEKVLQNGYSVSGQGSVFKVPGGTREKYMWITFDRFLGDPEYNWSYGNIYLYES